MRKSLVLLLVAVVMVFGTVAPANAAHKHHVKKHHHHHAKKHHAKKKVVKKKAVAKPAPASDATNAEYARITVNKGMDMATVTRIIGATGRINYTNDLTTYIYPDGAVVSGPFMQREYSIGITKVGHGVYPGRACYGVQVMYIRDAGGVWRVVDKENWSNIC